MSLSVSDRTPAQSHLMRKLFLLLLVEVALALGLVILYRQKPGFSLLLFDLLVDASLGVAAGLGARWILRQRSWFVRGAASGAMTVIGLALVGYLTNWQSGIGPLQFGKSEVDWLGLSHMVIAMDVSWVTLRAWKRPVAFSESMASSMPLKMAGNPGPHALTGLRNISLPKIQLPASFRPKARIKRRQADRALVARTMPPATVRPARSKSRAWRPLRRKPEVQLSVHEEHRCPYCLEPVKRNDPRGTVECDVCHTLHHRDCWDITGNCQVPHLND